MSKQTSLGNKDYVIALSFGNYLKGDGGTDKVIAEHQGLFNEAGVSFIQVAPVKSDKGLLGINFYTVVIDGSFHSVMHEKEIFKYFLTLSEQGYRLKAIYIHHLKKFKINFVMKLIDNTKAPVFFYIHDYYTVCNNYRLINSDGTYCGDDPASEKKCANCDFYKGSINHRNEMNEFFKSEADRITIIAPSQPALDIWEKSFNMKKSMRAYVIPHLKTNGSPIKNTRSRTGRIKIAYVGKMIPTKGAMLWEKLVNNKKIEESYDLIYIGNSHYQNKNVKNIEVTVTKEAPKKMVESLIDNHVDIAILWSTIPETYSYTYYEATEAGCYVITNINSGNISHSIRENSNGRVFDKEEEVINFLSDLDSTALELHRNAELGGISYSTNNEILSTLDDKEYRFDYFEDYFWGMTIASHVVDILYSMKYKRQK